MTNYTRATLSEKTGFTINRRGEIFVGGSKPSLIGYVIPKTESSFENDGTPVEKIVVHYTSLYRDSVGLALELKERLKSLGIPFEEENKTETIEELIDEAKSLRKRAREKKGFALKLEQS